MSGVGFGTLVSIDGPSPLAPDFTRKPKSQKSFGVMLQTTKMVSINGVREALFFESLAESFTYAVMADGLVPHKLGSFTSDFFLASRKDPRTGMVENPRRLGTAWSSYHALPSAELGDPHTAKDDVGVTPRMLENTLQGDGVNNDSTDEAERLQEPLELAEATHMVSREPTEVTHGAMRSQATTDGVSLESGKKRRKRRGTVDGPALKKKRQATQTKIA